jgi:16S rRNA (guanine527-N7)-methyltransferase
MSPSRRPKGEYRSARREANPLSPPGRSKGEYRSAQREGTQ